MMTYADTPMKEQVPAEQQAKIVHARLTVGDEVLMGGDAPPGRYESPKGITVTLGIDNPAEAERVFKEVIRRRHGHDADRGNFLGASLWHADGRIRHPVDGQLRAPSGPDLIFFRVFSRCAPARSDTPRCEYTGGGLEPDP